MSAVLTVSAVFLVVSVVALVTQGTSLRRLRRDPPTDANMVLAYRGLVRTSRLRVAAAAAYVLLGVATIVTPSVSGVAALGVFTVVQVAWITSGLADVRLKRQLMRGAVPSGRHRRN